MVVSGNLILQYTDHWYTYDLADRAICVDCSQNNGIYSVNQPSSMLLSYQAGLRSQETLPNGYRQIQYWADGDISSVLDTTEGSDEYHYAPSGYRALTHTFKNDGTGKQDQVICDRDLFQTRQITQTTQRRE